MHDEEDTYFEGLLRYFQFELRTLPQKGGDDTDDIEGTQMHSSEEDSTARCDAKAPRVTSKSAPSAVDRSRLARTQLAEAEPLMIEALRGCRATWRRRPPSSVQEVEAHREDGAPNRAFALRHLVCRRA